VWLREPAKPCPIERRFRIRADEAEETQSTLDELPDPDDEAVDDANELGEATPGPR
jgi:hypothetical protein